MILYKKGLDHEYLPIDGHPSFVKSSLKLSYGEDFAKYNEKRIVCVQTLGGTGALRLALDFLNKCLPSIIII
jgi:aspartate/tyrosine/aromatic aminotransferase